ncbi:MAG: glycosyltransferase [Cyclobacteriaceae bacterium]|nr:glycosyltransferase [Cyclobacteriaceae bacterium]
MGVTRLKKSTAIKNGNGISIVIAANNELENLKHNLPKVLSQEYSTYEVIVVDDRSSDESYEFLLELAKQHKNLKVLTVTDLPDHLNGKKYAITLGIKTAKFDQILLTDADCYPESKNWIGTFANAWGEKISFVVGFSQYKQRPGLLNYFIRFETLVTGIQYLASAALNKPYMGVGRNLSYSKTMFLSKKGFHGYQNLVGGDDDLFVNKHAIGANTQLVIGADALITSYPKTSWSTYFLQKTRHLSVGKHYTAKSKLILSVFSLTWIATWFLFPFLFFDPMNLLVSGSLLVLRIILMGTTILVFLKRTETRLSILGLILLDIMFALYYFVTGIKALLAKRVKWK